MLYLLIIRATTTQCYSMSQFQIFKKRVHLVSFKVDSNPDGIFSGVVNEVSLTMLR